MRRCFRSRRRRRRCRRHLYFDILFSVYLFFFRCVLSFANEFHYFHSVFCDAHVFDKVTPID